MNATKTVNVFGDKIQIRLVGSMWVSPCNGRQHPEARDAMRAELERYFTECGEDTDSDDVREQIDGYLDQMSLSSPADIGTRIGLAIGRDTLADGLPHEWTGLDPQDGDQLTAAGIEPGTPEWEEAERAAEAAFTAAIR